MLAVITLARQACLMNDDQLLSPYVFPIFFIGMWLAVSTVLGLMSGWFSLQRQYAPGNEPALLTLRGRSGSMGMGVGLKGIITLRACRSGLRISIWKVFAPFQRPILIPWGDIHATASRSLFTPATKLSFGMPERGRLKIDARSWQRLREAALNGGALELPQAAPHVTAGAAARGLLLQWIAVTLGAGSFFYFAPTFQGVQTGPPLAFCFGFPAIVFGIVTAVRFAREA